MNTVAQISTPPGEGGISIIKVSGPEAIESVNNIFQGKDLKKVGSHTLSYGHIVDNDLKIDEVLIGLMKAPNTYTGEDVVEINCHGGILITQKILKILTNNGIELAPPGEFTKRAFLNGKKSLDEANNIMSLIHASSEESLALAINSLNNSTENLIKNLLEELLQITTNIEVNIDYPEYEDLEIIKNQHVKNKVDKFISLTKEIVEDSKSGEIIKNGISTALIGRPNVGKSSLLNYLSKSEKAIVTHIAGTTRDTIENEVILGHLKLNLIDTAGIRNTDDIVEQLGVKKSITQIDKAQLILFILDAAQEISKEELELFDKIKRSNKPFLIILNKSDQPSIIDLECLNIKKNSIIKMSAKEKTGGVDLSKKIEEIFNLQYFDASSSKYISNIEHVIKLEKILELTLKIKEDLKNDLFLDLILMDLKDCIFILNEILGNNPQENYLNEIFSRFCLGK